MKCKTCENDEICSYRDIENKCPDYVPNDIAIKKAAMDYHSKTKLGSRYEAFMAGVNYIKNYIGK